MIKLAELLTSSNLIKCSLYEHSGNWSLHLTGNTYPIKNVLKQLGFHWDSLEKAFVYKKTFKTTEASEIKNILDSIKNQTNVDISVGEQGFNKLSIPGYETIYPIIPRGSAGKNKIYVKRQHHYAPMVSVSGNGAKLVKDVLKYFGFIFIPTYFQWQAVGGISQYTELFKYLKDNMYEVVVD